jgi:hypothetical protein
MDRPILIHWLLVKLKNTSLFHSYKNTKKVFILLKYTYRYDKYLHKNSNIIVKKFYGFKRGKLCKTIRD